MKNGKKYLQKRLEGFWLNSEIKAIQVGGYGFWNIDS